MLVSAKTKLEISRSDGLQPWNGCKTRAEIGRVSLYAHIEKGRDGAGPNPVNGVGFCTANNQ